MPKKVSAGILTYRLRAGVLEVLLVHPGGPFWANQDLGAWFLVKGEIEQGEDPMAAARREFEEELGAPPPAELVPLGTVQHKSGKLVHAFTGEGDLDVSRIESNLVRLEWPPRSGKTLEFPEVDRARFFSLEEAERRIHPGERELLGRLQKLLR